MVRVLKYHSTHLTREGPWLAKMTSDANAGALDGGLDAALVYMDKAPVALVRWGRRGFGRNGGRWFRVLRGSKNRSGRYRRIVRGVAG